MILKGCFPEGRHNFELSIQFPTVNTSVFDPRTVDLTTSPKGLLPAPPPASHEPQPTLCLLSAQNSISQRETR